VLSWKPWHGIDTTGRAGRILFPFPLVRAFLFLSFLSFLSLLCHCHLWSAHKTLANVRYELDQAKEISMEEAALYHLAVAESLLDAAEKQYEDADFTSADRLARQARAQVLRARNLHDFHQSTESLSTGNSP